MTEKLSRRAKLIYGSGDLGFSLTSTIIGAYLLIFLTDVVGLRPALAGVAIFIGRSWDYINDPLVGHLSDRTRTRWGRRRPFLLFGAIPMALTFALLWWRPPWESSTQLVIYYALAYMVFEAMATIAYMPYFALTPELTSDYDERTSLTGYRMFFSILGSLIAFTVPLMIIGGFAPENAPRVLTMGLLTGVISAAPLFLVFAFTKEKTEYMEQAKPTLKQSLRAAWTNKAFMYGLGIFLATWIAVEIVQAALLFYVKYVIVREPASDIIMASIFVTAIFALPIWDWVSRKYSKRWAYAAGIAFWAVVQLVLITVNASTGLPFILALCVLAGIGVAAAHVLPWAILPDAIEWGEFNTGERHEGMLYSLTTLTRKIATSFAIPLLSLLLEFTGYNPNLAVQPNSALWGIRIAIGPIPAVLLCIGIFLAFKYPLNREQFMEMVAQIKQKREG